VAAERRKRKEPRPRADIATIISALLAVVALGWGVYAYLCPRPTPAESQVIAKPPAPVSPQATNSTPPGTTARLPAASIKPGGTVATVRSWWHSFNVRVERDRHGVPWWQLALAWCLIIGFLLFHNRDSDHPGRWVVIGGAAYMYYFWPSLSWFGATMTPIATAIVAIFAFLEFGHAAAGPAAAQADRQDTAPPQGNPARLGTSVPTDK
jgi:hypothetical protein